jgi:hypothetical protein
MWKNFLARRLTATYACRDGLWRALAIAGAIARTVELPNNGGEREAGDLGAVRSTKSLARNRAAPQRSGPRLKVALT